MSKANRYSKGLTYLKNRVTTNQKHTLDPQKSKRREHKHKVKGNPQWSLSQNQVGTTLNVS